VAHIATISNQICQRRPNWSRLVVMCAQLKAFLERRNYEIVHTFMHTFIHSFIHLFVYSIQVLCNLSLILNICTLYILICYWVISFWLSQKCLWLDICLKFIIFFAPFVSYSYALHLSLHLSLKICLHTYLLTQITKLGWISFIGISQEYNTWSFAIRLQVFVFVV